jgi:hypothetical protein
MPEKPLRPEPSSTLDILDPANRAAWEARHWTSTAVERSSAARRRFRQLARREPADVRQALRLGVGALLIPLVGPCAWCFANAQLRAVAAGTASRGGARWLVVAKVCAIVATAWMGVLAAILAVTLAR